ncbi:MAG: hypothetical protein HQ581_14600 [Planctomycetes bacterium]|nr:hypothetical protein [Planctomycetota bacterium]
MNRNARNATAVLFVVYFATVAEAQRARPLHYKGWKAFVLKNDLVRLHVVPDIGGRVIQYALGEKEFLWVNPALVGKTSPQTGLDPDGGWMNYGGDKLWPAPQGWDNDQQWPGPPDAVLDGQPYRAETARNAMLIRLTSRPRRKRCGQEERIAGDNALDSTATSARNQVFALAGRDQRRDHVGTH